MFRRHDFPHKEAGLAPSVIARTASEARRDEATSVKRYENHASALSNRIASSLRASQ